MNILSKALVIIGILMITSFLAQSVWLHNKQNKDISNFNNNNDVNKIDKIYQSGDLIGIIVIPKIKVELPIYEDATESNLKLGACRIKETTLFDKGGNTAIAGHRSYAYDKMFNRLDELELEDQVAIKHKDKELHYKVSDIFIVTPDDLSVLNDTDTEVITLITCTPIRVASHRLIIRAERIP